MLPVQTTQTVPQTQLQIRTSETKKRWTGECIREIQRDPHPLTVSQLTTDGDSAAATGASEIQMQGKPEENLKDLRHFFESLRKQTSKAPLRASMFPGRTKTDRESVQKRFAQDLKIRCRSEYENAYDHFGGDIGKLTRAMSYDVDSILICYRGECGRPCQKP